MQYALIRNKKIFAGAGFSGVGVAVALCLLFASPRAMAEAALADTLPSPPSSVPAEPMATPAKTKTALPQPSASATGVFVPASPTPVTVETGSPAPSPTMASPSTFGASASGSGITQPLATPQMVEDTIKRLQKVDPINLDDMVKAQDAINRLDLLLEIEKRQSEIKKLRDERNKASTSNLLGAAIPASALGLPAKAAAPVPVYKEPASTVSVSKPASSGSSDGYALRRITGTDGRYLALIDLGDDKTRTVRLGETLPDDSKVTSITLTQVTLSKKGKKKTLMIPSDIFIVHESAMGATQGGVSTEPFPVENNQ